MNSRSQNLLQIFPGPEDIRRVVLDNDIILLVYENLESPSVVVNGYINCGSLYDPPGKLGLAYFTAAGLMRGTRQMSMQKIYDRLESNAASFGFNASMHTTSFAGRALAEDLPLLFEILSDCLRDPIFPFLQMEKLRAQILTSLMIRDQDTAEVSAIEFDKIIFKGHPYAEPEDGYPQTIRAIKHPDLKKFHAAQYNSQGMVVVVVGGIKADEVIDLAVKKLGDWKVEERASTPELPAPVPLNNTERNI